MTRTPSPTPNTPTSWVGYKDLARRQYERGDYDAALSSYTSALNPDYRCPASERQIILSNLIACRLKIGGPAQARAAVDNAKQCIELNPQWAKGHVRLASAYVALGGNSNDACNALQRALSIDPGNSIAREMLVRELRRDHAHSSSAAANSGTSNDSAGAAASGDNNPHSTSTYFTDREDTPRQQQQPQNRGGGGDAVDDSLTWQEWLQFHVSRALSWYHSQSNDVKTIFKITAVILLLYVAFGGRFGLEGGTRRMGNYGSNNAYDRFRQHPPSHSDHHGRRTNSYSSINEDYYDYGGGSHRGGSSSSWSSWSPLDGGLQSMLLFGGVAYGAHRMGMNPFQTLFMINMMGGGRRRFRPRGGFGMGGFGGGMGGFGGGMGGFRYGRRGRRF